ncbi:MAG: hypothetical protein OXE92_03295 [Bacteroidetes bacterium]|nr:hypothetical protein [Bacteroidota bacterium]
MRDTEVAHGFLTWDPGNSLTLSPRQRLELQSGFSWTPKKLQAQASRFA